MITRFIISVLAVGITTWLLPGAECSPWYVVIILAVVLGLINTFVRPIVKLFSLPVTMLTLGLFSLVINGLMVMLAAYFVDGFTLTGGFFDQFVTAFIFSIVLSIVNWVLKLFLKD